MNQSRHLSPYATLATTHSPTHEAIAVRVRTTRPSCAVIAAASVPHHDNARP